MRPIVHAPALAPGGVRLADVRRLVAWIARWRPLRVVADDAIGRGHPWRISGGWDAGQGRWELRLDPGYVNGREVLCPAQPVDELPEETLERLKLAGELPRQARARLSERPSLPLPGWRAVGTDAFAVDGSGEEVPGYFLERGVSAPESVSTSGQSLTTTQSATGEQAKARRLLRCADVVLNQPRPAARLAVGEGNRPEVRLHLPGDATPYLTVQAARYTPPGEAGSVREQFSTLLGDDGIDRFLVGRLWLLSPAGAAPGSEPTTAWQPHGQNFVFTHLDHDHAAALDVVEPTPLGFTVPLAGGVAQMTISSLTAEMEANDAYASAFLSTAQVTGGFWSV